LKKISGSLSGESSMREGVCDSVKFWSLSHRTESLREGGVGLGEKKEIATLLLSNIGRREV
jgi:hypothetical protein